MFKNKVPYFVFKIKIFDNFKKDSIKGEPNFILNNIINIFYNCNDHT